MLGRRGAGTGKRQDALQDRQGERCRFAGARLGATHDVLAADDQRNGLRLDWSGSGIAFFLDGAQQFRGQTKIGEGDFRRYVAAIRAERSVSQGIDFRHGADYTREAVEVLGLILSSHDRTVW